MATKTKPSSGSDRDRPVQSESGFGSKTKSSVSLSHSRLGLRRFLGGFCCEAFGGENGGEMEERLYGAAQSSVRSLRCDVCVQ